MNRSIVWLKNPVGLEFAAVSLATDHLHAVGVAIGSQPIPYRLDYELETSAGFITTRLQVSSEGDGWSRRLDLRRDPGGGWTAAVETEGALDLPPPGGEMAPLQDALDCDLGLSPLTNTMPMLRHALLDAGGPVDFAMAWVSVPDLSVHRSRQRYTFVRRQDGQAVVRYDSIDGSFTADLTVDADGLVLDYPGIGRLIG